MFRFCSSLEPPPPDDDDDDREEENANAHNAASSTTDANDLAAATFFFPNNLQTGVVGIGVRFSRHDCFECPDGRHGAERVEQNDDALRRDWTLFPVRRAIDLRANHRIRCKRGVRVRGGGEGVVEVFVASLDEALDENERRRGEDEDRARSKHPLRRLLPNLPPSISHDVPRRVGRPVSNRHRRVSRGLRSYRRHDRRHLRPRGVHVRRRPGRETNGRGNQRENGWFVRGSFILSVWCPRVDSRGIIIDR